jgi:hypothetical protein
MSRLFTIKDLEQLQKAGKIKGFTAVQKVVNKVKGIKIDKGSKNKGWIALNLKYYAEANNLILVSEFRFHPRKKYRFDWCLTNVERTIKIGIEYEGIFSAKSGHTTAKGYNKDTEKYNLASAAGWKLIRVTAMNYKSIFEHLNQMISG